VKQSSSLWASLSSDIKLTKYKPMLQVNHKYLVTNVVLC